jgi:hypothetical protein
MTVTPATSPFAEARWGFSIAANTDKKGAMTAAVQYGPNRDYPNRMQARRRIEDVTAEDLGLLACGMVDEQIGQGGSSLWEPPMFRSVTYTATVGSGVVFNVSLQSRKMQIDSGVFAPEPCTAEVMRGRRQSTLVETIAKGLGIDDAYEAFERLWRGGHIRV